MRKAEYFDMSHQAKELLARGRLALAGLGEVERLAQAFGACPWLDDAAFISDRSSPIFPSITSRLCHCAGDEACFKYGSLLRPQGMERDEFAALLEKRIRDDHDTLFSVDAPIGAGRSFMKMHQGFDANPALPPKFGTTLYGSILKNASHRTFDALSGAEDAAWWSAACRMDRKRGAHLIDHATQISRSLATILQSGKNLFREPELAKERGARAGEALAELAKLWPADPKLLLLCEAKLYSRRSLFWDCHFLDAELKRMATASEVVPMGDHHAPTYARMSSEDASATIAIQAALGHLPEPLLASLATHATGAFARMVEARRVELASPVGSASRNPPRI